MQCIVVKSDEFENSLPLIYFLYILIMLLLAPFGRSAAMTFNYRKLSLFWQGFALINYLNRRTRGV